MKLKKLIFLLFIQLAVVSLRAQETIVESTIDLFSGTNEFVAGDKIILETNIKNKKNMQLFCSNSYGSSIVEPQLINGKLTFVIPSFLAQKKGILSWKVLIKKQTISGNIRILAIKKPVSIESYLGPPSIDAGNIDFTMLVVIPTDSLDNPIKNNSKVSVNHQFLKSKKEETIFTNNLIGYKNIFAPLKSGRIIISSESLGLNSKEFDVDVMPSIATSFTLFMHRNHEYADGNQITTFYTSIIKDQNDNIVSDGSFVEFFITNKYGNILKTFGTTINGIAKAKMLHPDYEETWIIKGYLIGISESNTLKIAYKKVIESYKVSFSKNNRTIKIGALKSFMNQIIPDGLSVKLSVFKNNVLLNELYKESRNGFVEFYLDPNIFENNSYKIITETAKIKKEFKELKLW
ncbi:MAG: putative pyridoxamine 5'-phosphate oxidase family protein [Polaribacter sp.]|jgi:uncharacterized pyridoxamine 5'-phosphate oxidase family protein